MNKVIELAHNWRTTGAAKGELRQFTPSAKLKGVYELAQTILPKPNWRANWRGSGAQDFGLELRRVITKNTAAERIRSKIFQNSQARQFRHDVPPERV
jgi:hypothetical protein